MFVPFSRLEILTDLFTLGAYFLFMVYGSSIFFRKSRNHLHRVVAWVLAWWAFLVFDGYIGYLFDIETEAGRLASEQYDRFALVLDMTAAVGVVMIGNALTYTRKVTIGLVALHLIPFVIFMCGVLFTNDDFWTIVAFAWTLLYSLAYLGFFSLQIKSYINRVHAVYSDDTSRNLNWLKTLVWVFFGMLIVWAFPAYLEMKGTYILFYISSIALWWVALNKLLKQQPVNIRYFSGRSDESEDDNAATLITPENTLAPKTEREEAYTSDGEILDRRYAFAPRLERLFAEEQIYLQPDLNINELARALGTNRAYLSAYLNNVKEVSFFDYVNSWRLKKAAHLLSNSMETIDVIADNCGFNNTYSFRRVFVKAFGCTPTEWRHLSAEERDELFRKLS